MVSDIRVEGERARLQRLGAPAGYPETTGFFTGRQRDEHARRADPDGSRSPDGGPVGLGGGVGDGSRRRQGPWRGALAATPEGFSVETLEESDSTIPGIARVRLREAAWAPGAGLETRPMPNDMVCRMVQGELDVTVDGEPGTRKEGDLWTCHTGMMISDKNNGSVPAVMHVFDLLPE